MHVTAIIAAGGTGRRIGSSIPKQMLEIGGRTILERSVLRSRPIHASLTSSSRCRPTVAAAPPAWLATNGSVRVIEGGARRQDSVAAAFDEVSTSADIVLVHDAARPFVSADLIGRCIDAAEAFGGAIAALPASDTVKRVRAADAQPIIETTLPRETIYLAQTPQAFKRAVLRAAVELGRSGVDGTDEASLAERAGHAVRIVDGDPGNVKITTREDLDIAERRSSQSPAASAARVGIGYDLHRLVEGRPLILGGVTVPFDKGADGHSDADVVCHAVTDAILGAACLGDIGVHFPDTDPRWKGASSVHLLQHAARSGA